MINKEMVTKVTHWSDRTFSFTTTRKFPNRFNNGEFAMEMMIRMNLIVKMDQYSNQI